MLSLFVVLVRFFLIICVATVTLISKPMCNCIGDTVHICFRTIGFTVSLRLCIAVGFTASTLLSGLTGCVTRIQQNYGNILYYYECI